MIIPTSLATCMIVAVSGSDSAHTVHSCGTFFARCTHSVVLLPCYEGDQSCFRISVVPKNGQITNRLCLGRKKVLLQQHGIVSGHACLFVPGWWGAYTICHDRGSALVPP